MIFKTSNIFTIAISYAKTNVATRMTVACTVTFANAKEQLVYGGGRYLRPCQIGILLSVNSSLTNLGTYSQKHTNRKRKHKYSTTKAMHYFYK